MMKIDSCDEKNQIAIQVTTPVGVAVPERFGRMDSVRGEETTRFTVQFDVVIHNDHLPADGEPVFMAYKTGAEN